MNFALNLDLISVGITAAGIGLLGFTIYFSNRKSITNRTFLIFSLITIVWSIANYAQYQPSVASFGLWITRTIIFFACWHAFAFFTLCSVFPDDSKKFHRLYYWLLIPFVGVVSILTLTPLVFKEVSATSSSGVVTQIQNGPLIPVFGLTVAALILSGIIMLVVKAVRRQGDARRQIVVMSVGTFITFVCILMFNFVLPALYNNARFLPLSALFIFPFIACTAYAIYRYHLLNIKVLATEVVAFLLSVTSLIEIANSRSAGETVFRMSVFVLVLSFSVLMVRSIIREVEQREEIQRLSEEKSEFMTFASHEIRNPITAMRGYASLIMDGTTGEVSPKTKEVAETILIQGNDVLNLIAQYLSKSKMELGQIEFAKAPFDMSAIVSSIADGYKPHANKKGLTLETRFDPAQKYMVVGDEGKVKEVIGNIVDNSLKYTPKGGITISVERHGVAIRATVSDTGVGIDPAVLPQLFKKFSRADAQKVNLLGTGVGLYLAKTFIEAQGAHIWAESDGKDKGSRFIIEFPAA
ncbi:MAG: multi-sensor signal transduction histidine kinase [Candidatus Kaiserbacteria bacterium]|nr:multi-sensor signal transduction histidine kinase [Candidatus Kaiserbacteria bacterium]